MSVTDSESDESLPPLGDVLEFMRVIWQLDHGLQRASKRMEASLGVTGPQRLVIRIVGRFPGMPAGQLAKLLHLHPSTLTGILKRLERQGLLRRRADPRDGRRSLFGLTDKGRSFDVATEGTVEACIAQALDRASAQQLGAARDLLAAITELLESSLARPAGSAARTRRGESPEARTSRPRAKRRTSRFRHK
jgi:DNA-binding MarR family transcriptional regulator